MSLIEAVTGVFTSPALNAAAWGFVSSFVLCILLVLTKRWHGALTMDFTDGVQKFHTAPTPRIGGVPIVLAAYPVLARLKYRQNSGAVKFWYELIRPDLVYQTAALKLIL